MINIKIRKFFTIDESIKYLGVILIGYLSLPIVLTIRDFYLSSVLSNEFNFFERNLSLITTIIALCIVLFFYIFTDFGKEANDGH